MNAAYALDAVHTGLSWIANMDVDVKPTHIRKSSIICTIGPKTNTVEMILKLRKAGMNIVRMNFSHGSYEYHASVIANVRESQTDVSEHRLLAIALDTKGPEIRSGLMENDKELDFPTGHEMIFTVDEKYEKCCNLQRYYVDYKNLPKVIQPGKRIFVDDGIMTFEALQILDDKNVKVRALNAGKLCSRKGINLPGTDVDLPALSEKDRKDLQFGVEQEVDMIFASFIRCGQDIRDIRTVLGEKGKGIKVIAKIENHQGIRNFQDILKEADGIMVARGDLGIEIPISRVFIAQKSMIAQCNIAGKPAICATQMLESMTTNPRPTRAEVSDVANAILDGADCVMLSGETAKGAYPVEAVEMMHHVARLAESVICYPPLLHDLRALTPKPTENTETIAIAAVTAVVETQAKALLVLTTSGNSARLISKYRPAVPIITVTRSAQIARQIHLYRGCYPFLYEKDRLESWQDDVEARVKHAVEHGLRHKLIESGDSLVLVQGWKSGKGHTNTIRILEAYDE